MKNTTYEKYLNVSNFDLVVDMFHNSIIDTNRSFDFFVDWEKVEKNVKRYKIELNILNSLIGSDSFDNDLKKLLSKYPEIIPVIPILIAIRDVNLKVVNNFLDADSDITIYSFKRRSLSSQEIAGFISFFEKTGLKYFFQNLSSKSIQDYVAGVEVGMDTHARKNRSGDAMEQVLFPIIHEIKKKLNNFEILFQKKFSYLRNKYGINVSTSIESRKADFIVLKNNQSKIINIEANFYSGTGSKPQEIVDAYINRQNELKENGFYFIWVTDGYGWKGQKNQIKKGFEEIDYLLNLHFARKGLLEGILCQI